MSLAYLLSSLLFARLAAAAVNRTVAIDDTYGDAVTGAMPVYSPPGNWSQGQPCSFDDYDCLIDPDPSMVRNGTWHDSVGTTDDAPPRTIDLDFEGSFIAVYCVVSEVDQIQIAVSNMTFELDGQLVGKFYHDVTGQTDAAGHYEIHYNVLVFNGTAPQGNHTLRINSVGYSRMLFDYALYTTASDLENTSPSPTSTSAQGTASTAPKLSSTSHVSVGVIAGATAAGVVGLLGIGILGFLCLRRRRRPSKVARIDDGGPISKRWFYEQDDDIAPANRGTMAVSLPSDSESPTSLGYPYAHSAHSHHHNSAAFSREPSPSDSSVPLMEFSGINTDPFTRGEQPHIVVICTETRLEGPENAMTRLARKEVAKREAELTQRVREVEQALATRRPSGAASPSTGESSVSPATISKSSRALLSPASTTSSRSGESVESDAALRDELNELRAEMAQMRTVQQQMTLELREATEPPPSYQ
ncbi:hypothetical protein BC628DRAFT_1309993 [Trametes gibbosa]|nr:hypothetical protein BC628DRAFT_1309993 [Trametes gibbosa]